MLPCVCRLVCRLCVMDVSWLSGRSLEKHFARMNQPFVEDRYIHGLTGPRAQLKLGSVHPQRVRLHVCSALLVRDANDDRLWVARHRPGLSLRRRRRHVANLRRNANKHRRHGPGLRQDLATQEPRSDAGFQSQRGRLPARRTVPTAFPRRRYAHQVYFKPSMASLQLGEAREQKQLYPPLFSKFLACRKFYFQKYKNN